MLIIFEIFSWFTAVAQCRYSGNEECNSSCSNLSHMKCKGRRDVLAISFISMCLFAPSAAHGKSKSKAIYDERRLLEQNRKIQQANNTPEDFPNFIREGIYLPLILEICKKTPTHCELPLKLNCSYVI
jgi:hypothetical protein